MSQKQLLISSLACFAFAILVGGCELLFNDLSRGLLSKPQDFSVESSTIPNPILPPPLMSPQDRAIAISGLRDHENIWRVERMDKDLVTLVLKIHIFSDKSCIRQVLVITKCNALYQAYLELNQGEYVKFLYFPIPQQISDCESRGIKPLTLDYLCPWKYRSYPRPLEYTIPVEQLPKEILKA